MVPEIHGMGGKGALLIQYPDNPISKVVKFQYNPLSLSRSFQPSKTSTAGQGETAPSEAFGISNPPVETFSVEIELDATDGLEFPEKNPNTVKMGINPELAALESLLYPSSSHIASNSVLASLGFIEIIPPEGPSIFLIWGPNRMLPVSLTALTINEEAYDSNLNPIRAKVTISLKVLNYAELPKNHGAYSIYQTHHRNLERMASLLSGV